MNTRRTISVHSGGLLARVIVSLLVALALGACATVPQETGESSVTSATEDAPTAGEVTSEAEPAAFEPFVRIDRDDPAAWDEKLANLRLIT